MFRRDVFAEARLLRWYYWRHTRRLCHHGCLADRGLTGKCKDRQAEMLSCVASSALLELLIGNFDSAAS